MSLVYNHSVKKIFLILGISWAVVDATWNGSSIARAEGLESAQEAKIREIRFAEIEQLKIALDRRNPEHRKADLYLRLAEIYVEIYRAEFLLEGRRHEALAREGRAPKKMDRQRSRPYLVKALKACQSIIRLKIPYQHLDKAYFFIGYGEEELGHRESAMRYYKKIAKEFPRSLLAAEAFRALGEEAFNQRRYKDAQEEFSRALSVPSEINRASVLHKLGWSYYRTRQYDKAISSMKSAVEETTKHEDRYLALKEEALRDLAIFMTDAGRVQEAIKFFERYSGNAELFAEVLENLAREYERKTHTDKAIQTYETILRVQNNPELNARVTMRLIELEFRKRSYKSATARLQNLDIQADSGEPFQQNVSQLKVLIRKTGIQLHKQVRDEENATKHKNTHLALENLYQTYLQKFLNGKENKEERNEILLYLAEVKTVLQKYSESTDLYRQVAESDSSRANEALGLLANALAAQLAHAGDRDSGDVEDEYFDIVEKLERKEPQSDLTRIHQLKSAQILAGKKSERDSALEKIKSLINNSPATEEALTAARLWVQIADDAIPKGGKADDDDYRESSEKVLRQIEEIRAHAALMKFDEKVNGSKLSTFLMAKENEYRLGGIQLSEKRSDYKNAAVSYFSLGNSQKDIKTAEAAYSKALKNGANARDLAIVQDIYSKWHTRNPKSNRVFEDLKEAATRFFVLGDFSASGILFETTGRDFNDISSLHTAARVFEGIGELDRATMVRKRMFNKHPRHELLWKTALDEGLMRLQRGQVPEAAKAFEICVKGSSDYAPECGVRLAQIYKDLKQKSRAEKLYRQIAKTRSQVSDEGRLISPFVSYALFELAYLVEDSAKFEPLSLPENKLRNELNRRLQFFEKLSKMYLQAVEFGGPWAVASLHQLASWTYHLADEIETISPPPSLGSEGHEQFKKTLLQVSDPLRKRALRSWQDAIDTAQKYEILSPILPQIIDFLSTKDPQRWLRVQGRWGHYLLFGLTPNDDSLSAQSRLKEKLTDKAAWVDYGNTLWGQHRPILAEIAYNRALSIDKKYAPALNNKAVVLIHQEGQKDWFNAALAFTLLKRATKIDPFFVTGKKNLATLFNYYRLFPSSKPFWEQVMVKNNSAEVVDDFSVAQLGIGQVDAAVKGFQQASHDGLDDDRFNNAFHLAAIEFRKNNSSAFKSCVDYLEDLSADSLQGFERESYDRLMQDCKGRQ